MAKYVRVYDKEARELVTPEEYAKRQAQRLEARGGQKSFDFERKFERGTWKIDKATHELIPVGGSAPLDPKAPFIQTDEIPETESLATNERRVFTSKKKLLDHYKENGCVVREKGMCDTPPPPRKASLEEIRDDAARALNDLRWGNVPLSEREKEVCRQESRKFEEYKKRQR